MIVDTESFKKVALKLMGEKIYGLDCETYGLRYDDRLFSFAIAADCGDYYFNFKEYPFLDKKYVLPYHYIKILNVLFGRRDSIMVAHNAKFEMHKLGREGAMFNGLVHCTMAMERIVRNNYMSYSLDACAKRRGLGKDDRVMEFIKDQKLWTNVEIPGKKKKEKRLHFDKVPFDLIAPYCIHDAKLGTEIAASQLDYFTRHTSLYRTVRNEQSLTKVLYQMESAGIKTSPVTVEKGWNLEHDKLRNLYEGFEKISGLPFKAGPNRLREAFDKVGQIYKKKPDTGNPIFDKTALAQMDSPLAKTVRNIRLSEDYIQSYYSTFSYMADDDHQLHANAKQAGTDTGRMAYAEPNLQNVPKEEAATDHTVRSCFVPREGYCFVMIDYDQMEYRMMADYAGETQLIKRILNGEDVHDATADLIGGITRSQAKTINFGLLYGMGSEKLAAALRISKQQASELRDKYFYKLPAISRWIKKVVSTGRNRGYIFNWTGRRCYIDNPNFAYKLPNHLIQGGCADVVKHAMVQIDRLLENNHSRMLVQVHDELLFEIHKSEMAIIDPIVDIMESTYIPYNGMKLTCSVEHSWQSWGSNHKVVGCPSQSNVISAVRS